MRSYITSDPDILGGTPVIKGTRIPVEKITFFIKDGFNLTGIQKLYPHVDLGTLKGVIDELFGQLEQKRNASLS